MMELRRLFNPSNGTDTIRENNKSKPGKKNEEMLDLEKAARKYLQDTIDHFPLDDVSMQVSNQVTFVCIIPSLYLS